MVARALDRGGLADAAELDRVLLAVAVRDGLVRRVRHLRERRVALGLGLRELRLERAELLLDPLQLLDLLRSRPAVDLLPGAQVVDAGHELAPALVGGEQRVEGLGRALPGERAPEAVRVVARGPEVDQLLGRQELHERVEVGLRQRRVARHHRLEAGLHVRLRILDRLPRERLERLLRLLRVLGELVEVGADLAVRPGGGVRVAAAAPVRREDALAVGAAAARGGAAARRRLGRGRRLRSGGRLRRRLPGGDAAHDRLRHRRDRLRAAAARERERERDEGELGGAAHRRRV